ncbi:hypothetical protein GX51_04105 [Blastomyces parvus]|uniref:Thioesterase domain-containing protein n=1 Tax=Blastomyces parvus TaxID=2060905 RepID=A0A2B7WVG8_9EURO|nr:hypothetical protein GX51_04105 [Blastomyces parvus]
MGKGSPWEEYQAFVASVPVPQADIDFFSKIPCARPYLDSNTYRAIPFSARFKNGGSLYTTSDKFFNTTLHSPDTIPHLLALERKRNSDVADGLTLASQNTVGGGDADLVLFVDLREGLCGYMDTAHGGALGALLDEALGTCLEGCRRAFPEDHSRLFTANLEVSYRSPVAVPGVVCVKSWLRRKEGRKWFLEGQILGEDGEIKCEAKALFLGAREKSQL